MKSIFWYLPLFILSINPKLGAQVQVVEYQCPVSENSFRGLSASSDSTVWLSSNQGQVWFYSLKEGWSNRSPNFHEDIQWRDIEAFNDSTAVILSAGSPALVLRTEDYGQSWQMVYRNTHPDIFFDAMDFNQKGIGYAFADALDDYLGVIVSNDFGKSWQELSPYSNTKVRSQQGGFAASGTCLLALGDSAWALVLGGETASYIRLDKEENYHHELPMDKGAPSKGAFSLDYKNQDTLIVVGGDYLADSLSNQSICLSADGGQSWTAPYFPKELSSRYWSCVKWQGNRLILCSRFGTAISMDNGQTWQYHNNSFYSNDGLWFSGPNGRLGRLIVSYK